jgi:glutamate dehydrogenase/leucine dehydrogenase
MNAAGFTHQEIVDLFLNKNGNELYASNMLSFEEVNAKIWDIQAEVFLPCAASRLITRDQIDRMLNSGIEVVSAGANVPFADPEIFFGPIADYADSKMSVIPDFISNCGMARVFAYLMSNDLDELTDAGIFQDTSTIIRDALVQSHAKNSSKTGIAKTAFEIALNQLVK